MRMTLEGKGYASDNYISPRIDLIKLETDVLGYILIQNYLQFPDSFYFPKFCPKYICEYLFIVDLFAFGIDSSWKNIVYTKTIHLI